VTAARLAGWLHEVDVRLGRALDDRDPFAVAPARAITLAGCKRVRAALALASARAVGAPLRLGVELAAAIELVHAFSLVHDDLEDGAATRRGHPAVHVAEGDAIAINAGDALHAAAWSVILGLDAPAARVVAVARRFGDALERMVAGQASDLVWTRDRRRDLTIAAYLEMVRGKTGALLGFSTAAPAVLVGHPAADRLYLCGEELGVALQVLDDVASIRGDAVRLGKPVGPDANGAGSAPALLATPGDDGTDASIDLARRHWERALDLMKGAGLGPAEELETLVKTLLTRLLEHCGAEREARAVA
jgi:geranylgeranyl diphosphate synthase type I